MTLFYKERIETEMIELRGKDVVAAMKERMLEEIERLDGIVPKLAIIRVGEKPDDISYERGAIKRMATVGIECSSHVYPEVIGQEEFLREFQAINEDSDVDGILLLRPLPKHLDERMIENKIDPQKDVDGISPVNMAKVFAGDNTGFAPCTAEAVVEMLEYAKLPLAGKNVTVIGRSLVVGKPLAMLLLKKNCTVTICHTKTLDMKAICQKAEILIAAAGRAKMVDKSYVGQGAVLIDVGINMDENNKLCGDADFESISECASMATPVPGGVGTVTTSVLASHVVRSAAARKKGE